MKKFNTKLGMVAAAATIAALSASPAMAGRCGHSYPVDSPTSLAKVARACNVSLSALREANTGVDPSYVSPGEHLAIPDEIDSATDIPSGAANVDVDEAYDDAPIYRYVEYREPARHRDDSDYYSAPVQPSYVEPAYIEQAYSSTTTPYFVRASAVGPQPTLREDKGLSYQKLSAARIRNAGVSTYPQTPLRMAPVPQKSQNSVMISTRGDMLYGDPLSPLMECAVLRRTENGKIKQVREFKPLPEGRDAPAHCAEIIETSMTAPAGLRDRFTASDFLRSEYEGLQIDPMLTVLEGYVSAADAECITLRANDGMVWRVGVALAPVEMLGKQATIWAELTDSPQCGGLAMNRAVYAERIR